MQEDSGRKNLQFTSPGYTGWCTSRNKVRARMGLVPIHRPSLAPLMEVKGSQPTKVDLPRAGETAMARAVKGGGEGGGLSIISTIDEIG